MPGAQIFPISVSSLPVRLERANDLHNGTVPSRGFFVHAGAACAGVLKVWRPGHGKREGEEPTPTSPPTVKRPQYGQKTLVRIQTISYPSMLGFPQHLASCYRSGECWRCWNGMELRGLRVDVGVGPGTEEGVRLRAWCVSDLGLGTRYLGLKGWGGACEKWRLGFGTT